MDEVRLVGHPSVPRLPPEKLKDFNIVEFSCFKVAFIAKLSYLCAEFYTHLYNIRNENETFQTCR